MILEASKKHNIDLNQSWMIGDDERDVEAGKKAGCNIVLVDKNKNIKNVVNRIIKI